MRVKPKIAYLGFLFERIAPSYAFPTNIIHIHIMHNYGEPGTRKSNNYRKTMKYGLTGMERGHKKPNGQSQSQFVFGTTEG